MTNALEARAVTKSFGRKTVLAGLDLEVPEGSVAVLLGRNGVGKTTFLRAAIGMIPIDSGSLRVAGFDSARDAIALRQRAVFVPDQADVYPWMTVDGLFRFLRPVYPKWSSREAERLADAFEVPRDVPFRALSRGQSMKAMLAAALAPEPAVLLLDEPFGGLDPIARDEVLRAVVGEIRTGSRTVICSTHDLEIASRIADRIAVMNAGRIERYATVDELAVVDPERPVPVLLHEALGATCPRGPQPSEAKVGVWGEVVR